MQSSISGRLSVLLCVAVGLCLSCGQDGSRLDPTELPYSVIKEKRWSQTFCVSAVDCPPILCLDEPLRDPALVVMLVNDQPVPHFSCADATELRECPGPHHYECPCTETWSYHASEDDLDGRCAGIIEFADHFDPCQGTTDGCVKIELVYITAE